MRAATVSLGAGFDTALVTTSSGPVPRIELSAPIELDGRWYIVRTVYF